MLTPLAGAGSLNVVLGPASSGGFAVGLPLLTGESDERIFPDAWPIGAAGCFNLSQTEDWLLGHAALPLAGDLAAIAQQAYRDLFRAARGWHLARIWNYVPEINAPGPDGRENYRSFCCGRSLAFEEHFGRDSRAFMPAASAVGRQPGALSVVFAASRATPCHVENPLQVPAYDYPREHGPRAPSFARATIVAGEPGATVFISGTAAVRGHATVAPQRTRTQLDCTLENLREISRACGLGPDLAAGRAARRHFKIYLRHAEEQPAIAAVLEERLLRTDDTVSYLHANICREPLMVEIESTLWNVAAG